MRLGEHGIPARVEYAEYLGADTVVACRVGDVPMLARVPGRVVLASGMQVRLASDEPMHMFDAVSGHRIESNVTAKETIGA
jgi:sn-glycerol 3-phosphate transport system ATP-binding protein